MNKEGYILITVLLSIVMMTSLLMLLMFQIMGTWKQACYADGQLHSLLMAENGLVQSLTLLPSLDLEPLLLGPDLVIGSRPETENDWRDPISMKDARELDMTSWAPKIDDGILYSSENKPVFSAGKGHFVVRFSNNPEEEIGDDSDRIVLVRATGVVPLMIPNRWFPEIRNHVASVEARVRKEMIFSLPGPLVLFGKKGDFEFLGTQFRIMGDEVSQATFIAEDSSLEKSFYQAIDSDQMSCFQGSGSQPKFADQTETYRSHKDLSRIFTTDFWENFEKNLPDFSDQECSDRFSIHRLPEGSNIRRSCQGVVVTSGDTEIGEDAAVRGLLIHLGGGRLSISKNAQITGGVWLSDTDCSGGELNLGGLSFMIGDNALIAYDPNLIAAAVVCFPPTLLDWRVLFK